MKIIGVCCSCLPKSISQKAVKEFLRGASDNPEYRAHDEELLRPFDGWGFERVEPFIISGGNAEEMLQKLYEAGKAL